jgi:two-component system, OmpR family, response regulator CssR
MRLLLLEDNTDYKETMQEYLQSLGYDVDSFEDGDTALDAVYSTPYQLLLLDIKVPGKSGYDIVKTIREDGNDTPVIFITSLTDIDNLSIGYELGCNDYIRKPFASRELRYRVEQVLKQFYFHSGSDRLLLKEGYAYDIKTKQLIYNETAVALTPKEQKVWDYLIIHLGRYITLQELWLEVWEGKDISEADIRMCIKGIRDKTAAALIVNQRGQGYRIDRE